MVIAAVVYKICILDLVLEIMFDFGVSKIGTLLINIRFK